MSMEVVLSSRNKKKIRELRELFSLSGLENVKILSLDDIGITFDIEENGGSFEENSLIKAVVPAKAGYIGIADDSGLCVDVLNGAPGIYSARYSGPEADDAKNNAKLISELEEIPDNERTARFVCVVSCVFPEKLSHLLKERFDKSFNFKRITEDLKCFYVRGECEGLILREKRGNDGFGYDPVFFVPDRLKTFAELSSDEKNEISHRGIAMRSFMKFFVEIMKGIQC